VAPNERTASALHAHNAGEGRDAMNECKKCHRPLHDCQACDGGRKRGMGGIRLTCSRCNTTGLVCSQHGGHWK